MEKILLKTVFSVKSISNSVKDESVENSKRKINSSDGNLFIYSDKGSVTVNVNGKTHRLEKGSAVILPPECEAEIIAESDVRYVTFSFYCQGGAVEFLTLKPARLSGFDKTALNFIYGKTSSDKISETFIPPECKQQLKSCLEIILADMLADVQLKKSKTLSSFRPDKKDYAVDRIIALLNENMYRRINLDDIAEELFYSKTYLKRVFKQKTGTTIMDYYAKIRIEEAKRLLSERKSDEKQIAKKLQFSSVNYFCSVFKKYTGETPKSYTQSLDGFEKHEN